MNRNQLEGSVTDVLGAMQQWLGGVISNPRLQRLGAARRVEGKVRLGVGNVEHAIATASQEAARAAGPTQRQSGIDQRRPTLKRAWGFAQ